MSAPWLTIVTPVLDDLAGLRRTLASIATQDQSGVEVLVVDSSQDRDEVPSVAPEHARVLWVEPEGVYAAMNAGLAEANGTYVQFLNAGDALHSASVLSEVRTVAEADPTWIIGSVRIIDAQGRSILTPRLNYSHERDRLFARGLFPQHQATFVRRELLTELGGFSTSFRIASDYEMALRIAKIADPLQIAIVVADFYEGGISTSHWQESFREFHRARLEIFDPRGWQRIREQWDYLTHFMRVWLYREALVPLRRRALR